MPRHAGMAATRAPARKAPVRLQDLCEEDKDKVARLVAQLSALGDENERLQQALSAEREMFEARLGKLRAQNDSVIKDSVSVKSKFNKCLLLVRGYHERVDRQDKALKAAQERIRQLSARPPAADAGVQACDRPEELPPPPSPPALPPPPLEATVAVQTEFGPEQVDAEVATEPNEPSPASSLRTSIESESPAPPPEPATRADSTDPFQVTAEDTEMARRLLMIQGLRRDADDAVSEGAASDLSLFDNFSPSPMRAPDDGPSFSDLSPIKRANPVQEMLYAADEREETDSEKDDTDTSADLQQDSLDISAVTMAPLPAPSGPLDLLDLIAEMERGDLMPM